MNKLEQNEALDIIVDMLHKRNTDRVLDDKQIQNVIEVVTYIRRVQDPQIRQIMPLYMIMAT